MKSLYKHQQKFIDKNPDKALLVWEGGTGKTIAACLWIKSRQHTHRARALVVCPKSIKIKWQKELREWGATAHVCSRDEIKKVDLTDYHVLVIDEAQDFASPLFSKERSARSTVVYNYVKGNPSANVLLLTATPIRSTPWNIHTLACYLGIYWPIKKFRDEFFYLTDLYGRFHYEKKKGWQNDIRPYIEKIADIVLMKDCVDVPKQHMQTVDILWTRDQEKALPKEYQSPMAAWVARHRAENGDKKFIELQKLMDKYQKIIVVCHYREQIDDYVLKIGEDRLVFMLHGGIKDAENVIKDATEAKDCVFFVQASMGAGFDADSFSVVVFASMSFKYIDYAQMKYRVKRIHNLHENTFIHLLGGKCDRAVYNAIQDGKNFDPHEYLADITQSSK